MECGVKGRFAPNYIFLVIPARELSRDVAEAREGASNATYFGSSLARSETIVSFAVKAEAERP